MPAPTGTEQLLGFQGRFSVFLSDGQYRSPVLLPPSLESLVKRGTLRNGSIVEVKELEVKRVISPWNETKA